MELNSLSDERLLSTRDERAGEAFGLVYLRHERGILAYHQRRVRDPETASDLTADTFLCALESRVRFEDRGPGSCLRWLYGIAAHTQSRHWRSKAAANRRDSRLQLERCEYSDDQLAAVQSLETDEALLAALAHLPVAQAEAVTAYVVNERSCVDLASEFGVRPATVRQRVTRGLIGLRRTLEGNQS